MNDSTTLPSGDAKRSTEALQTAEALANALAATLTVREVGKTAVLLAPEGYTLHDLTAARNAAEPWAPRKKGEATLLDLASFVTYVKDQGQATTGYIYANPDSRKFTAVFNDFRDTIAGWRDHKASYFAEFTPEFKRWMENSAKQKTQTEFAEFIEDNFADIVPPFAQQLLDVATTIQAKTDINFSSAKRLDNGQVQLGYTEIINAQAGADGALTIPREFELGMRLFKNGAGYKLKARLKYRLASGSVKFWYELDRPERAIEDAFKGYVDTVRETSGYTILLGQP